MTVVPFHMTDREIEDAARKTRLRALRSKLIAHGRKQRLTRLTLSERCEPRELVGTVRRVSTTGTFVIVESDRERWHVPIDEIEDIA